VGGAIVLTESKAEGENRYDVWGALTVTLGLGLLVYGFTLAENGWTNPLTIAFLVVGAALLALFIWVESRVSQPLLPLRVVADRVRGGAFLIQGIAGAIMIGATVYLTFHLQFVLGMGAFQAGLASLPLPIATMVIAPIATKLLPVIGPRPMLIVGPLIAAVGLFTLSGITPDGAYFVQIAPALALLGIGMGFVFIPLQNLALSGVAAHDAGVASAVANSAMQIGGSIGLSVFTAVYAASVGGHSQADVSPEGLTDAYGWTFVAASILMVAASVIAALMVRGTKEELLPTQGQAALAAH
jgi:MFS family permease